MGSQQHRGEVTWYYNDWEYCVKSFKQDAVHLFECQALKHNAAKHYANHNFKVNPGSFEMSQIPKSLYIYIPQEDTINLFALLLFVHD